MTPDEALRQVGEFLRGLGAAEPDELPVRAMIGAAIVELAHVEPVLTVSALVYRFRAAPRPGLVDAVLAAATPADTGGGRLVAEDGAVLRRRAYAERVPAPRFATEVDALGRASVRWAEDLFARAVERYSAGAHGTAPRHRLR